MNARLAANVLRARPQFVAPPAPKPMKTMSKNPVVLRTDYMGKPDPALARALGQHVRDATPAIVIPLNPLTHAKVRRVLRSLGIH